ncbi:UPF0524 protein C3orf70 homolog [Puma concolor]|uniref:UPF0524 protein C3orf70 homolog n=1 Tax=Puma concolor TaxID=9696 RepID=A0A6P6H1A9_PUMCO|nr:UPF0524 protein C3orf70 homolog [Puma concolor]
MVRGQRYPKKKKAALNILPESYTLEYVCLGHVNKESLSKLLTPSASKQERVRLDGHPWEMQGGQGSPSSVLSGNHNSCHWGLALSVGSKYVYQPMTPVEQLPSTEIPAKPREPTNTIQISVSLTEHFLKFASVFQPPLPPDSPRYCMISDLFIDNYQVKCINGKMCYVQKQPAPHSHKMSPEEVSAHDALISRESSTPKIDHCSSPSSSEDSGINAIGAHYVESCDEDTEEGAELSSEEDYSPESSWEPDECTLLSPSQSDLEVIETIETTV